VTRSTASPPTRASDGRTRLLDTAERLLADRGITGVSLREITEAAGQRNASVVQYHFGSRAGLVTAIVERHMSVVDADRTARLDAAKPTAEDLGVREAMRILVEPLAECLRTSSGRAYLRIVQHLVDQPPGTGATPAPLSASNESLRRVGEILGRETRALPRVVRVERQAQTTSFLLRALADRAAHIDREGIRGGRTGHELFVANLVDVLVAVLTTPPSAATRRRATRR
jgi:AcrR family transcriptional regulator